MLYLILYYRNRIGGVGMKLEPSAAKGEANLVVQSVEAFKEREKMLDYRAGILEAEFSRLAGEPTLSVEEVRSHLAEKYAHKLLK